MSSTESPIAPTDVIRGYHAHVYYDADTRATAERIRTWVEQRFDVRMGRWRDAPVGPHTGPMYQIAFTPQVFPLIIPWLALNHSGLSILVHPETGDALADHTEHALWIGTQLPIRKEALT